MCSKILICLLCAVLTTINCEIEGVDVLQTYKLSLEDRPLRDALTSTTSLKLTALFETFETAVSKRCLDHLSAYADALIKRKDWALRMIDSTTKLWDGLLMMDAQELGSFDECLDVEVFDDLRGTFRGQHCQVAFLPGQRAPPVVKPTSWTSLQEQVEKAPHSSQNFEDLPNLASVAHCIPSTCSASEWRHILSSALQQLLTSVESPLTVDVEVDDKTCYTADGLSLSAADKTAICILLSTLLIALFSTAYDLRHRASADRNDLWSTFSLYTNARHLVSTKSSEDSLKAVNGVRVLSVAWVTVGHLYAASVTSPSVNTRTVLEEFHRWQNVHILSGTLAVDTFLVMSGMLLTYVFMKEMIKPKAKFQLSWYYVHRYLRLTPALSTMVLLQATLFVHLGSGPLWSQALDRRETCSNNWWSVLLYVQNYVNDGNEQCIQHAWYLSVDMQLFALSPLILFPLLKTPKLGLALLLTMIVGGLATAVSVAYVYKMVPFFVATTTETGSAEDNVRYMYHNTATRCTPWLIGVGLGYLLHKTRSQRLLLSRPTMVFGWVAAAVCLLVAVCGLIPFMSIDYEYKRLPAALFVGCHRSVWALGTAWVIFACVSGYGGFVNSFLSWKFFLPLSRLSYCVYLIHPHYLQYLRFSARTKICWSNWTVALMLLDLLIVTAIFAIPLTLLTESPVVAIKNVLRKKGGNEKTLHSKAN